MNQNSSIVDLDKAWEEIEKAIHHVGSLIRDDPFNEEPLHRYEAYKTALSLIADNYVNQIYYDRNRPESLSTFNSIFNYVGASPDYGYQIIHLEPGCDYRVWGTRGDAKVIDIQQLIGWYGENKDERSTVTVANELFDEQDVGIDEQGNFDFVLSSSKQGDHWWKLNEKVNTFFVREYFTDYTNQRSLSIIHVDKLGEDKGSTLLSMQESIERMNCLAYAIRDYEFNFQIAKIYNRVGLNLYEEILFGDDAGVTDQRYFQARFDIKPTEALIGKWKIPEEYLYWGIALYNDAYQMLNWANRQVNLNEGVAKIGSDGTIVYVLSHADPGVANWLDVDGHEQGMITIRTKKGSDFEFPTLELVPLSELAQHLPPDIDTVTSQQRQSALAERRKHFQEREKR